MQDRGDRSLANTFPFNNVEIQVSAWPSWTVNLLVFHLQAPRGSPSDTSYSHRAQSSLGSALFKTSGADIQSQVHSTYSNIKAQAGGPASSFHLDRQSSTHAQAGLTLLAGYGSQSKQTSQEAQLLSSALAQASSAATAYSAAQAPVHAFPQFSNFPPVGPAASEVPAITVTNNAVIVSDTSLARAASQCPAATSLPIQQCQSVVNACWSVGVSDVDCPGYGLCW